VNKKVAAVQYTT